MLPCHTYSFSGVDGRCEVGADRPAAAGQISSPVIHQPLRARLLKSQRRQHFRQHNNGEQKVYVKVLNKLAHCAAIGLPQYTWTTFDTAEQCNMYIDWSTLPPVCNPVTYLPPHRYHRKQQQLSNILCILEQLLHRLQPANRPLHIVDACSSSGHVAFAAAYLYPQHTFTLIDRNSTAIEFAQQRVQQSALHNIRAIQGDITDVTIKFDVIIGLHACGHLTDVLQCQAVKQRAAYILCSCCVGKIQPYIRTAEDSVGVQYPRSDAYRQTVSSAQYSDMIVAADYSEHHHTDNASQHRLCKLRLEQDRNLYATQYQYITGLAAMMPLNCSAKHDIVVGYTQSTERRACADGVRETACECVVSPNSSHQ